MHRLGQEWRVDTLINGLQSGVPVVIPRNKEKGNGNGSGDEQQDPEDSRIELLDQPSATTPISSPPFPSQTPTSICDIIPSQLPYS